MAQNNKLNKFIDFLTNNAVGVLTTITNEQLEINSIDEIPFDFEIIQKDVDIPLVFLSVNYSGDQNFQLQFALPRKMVAMLSDFMMLGDGSAEYDPSEHNDAIKEMFNQILGSLTAELSGEGINITGDVSNVESTDLEIQKEFLADNIMIPFTIKIIGQELKMYLVLDQVAIDSIESLFPTIESNASNEPSMDELLGQLGGNESKNQSVPQPSEQRPVNVSRADFSEFDNRKPEIANNINLGLLMDINLPVTVELGRKNMRIKELLDLGQGSVVELDKLAGDFVDVLINGQKFAVGEIMVADDNFAVRIVNLISREDRIKSLGR
jgi:flagellar motor switch protein FliN/FliY